jgi:hypothetical protein
VALRAVAEESGVSAGKLIHPTRLALRSARRAPSAGRRRYPAEKPGPLRAVHFLGARVRHVVDDELRSQRGQSKTSGIMNASVYARSEPAEI